MKGNMPFWQNMGTDETLKAYQTDSASGLSDAEAARRRKKYGKNDLWKIEKAALTEVFFYNFFDVSGVLLTAAAILSIIFSDKTAGTVSIIFVILAWALKFLCCLLYRYTYDMIALSSLPHIKVKRDGRIKVCSPEDIVVGDIVFLEPGDAAPADIRLISGTELTVNEKKITGSEDVHKSVSDHPVKGSFSNIVFASSMVSGGEAQGIVVESGRQTLTYRKSGYIKIKSDVPPRCIKVSEAASKKIGIFLLILAFVAFPLSLICGADMLDSFFLIMTMCFCTLSEFYSVFAQFIYFSSVSEIKSQDNKSLTVMKADVLDKLSRTDTVVFSDLSLVRTGKLSFVSEYISGITLKADRIAALRVKIPVEESISRLSDLMFSALYMTGGKTPFALSADAEEYDYGNALIEEAYGAYKRLTVKKDEEIFSGRTFVEYEAPCEENSFLRTVMFYENGKYYTAVSGAVDKVLDRCRRFYTAEGTLPLTADAKSIAYNAYRTAVQNGFSSIAVAVKESPYNSLIRMSVQMSEMTFLGFVTVNRPVSRDFPDICDTFRRIGIKLAVFFDGSESELCFIKSNNMLEEGDVYINEGESVSADNVGGNGEFVVIAESIRQPSRRMSLFSALKKNGRRLLFVGNSSKDGAYLKRADTSVISSPANGDEYMRQGIRGLSDIFISSSKGDSCAAENVVSAMITACAAKLKLSLVFTYLLSSAAGKILFILLSIITGIYLLTPVYAVYAVIADMLICGFLCLIRKRPEHLVLLNEKAVESDIVSFVLREWRLIIMGGAGGVFACGFLALVLKLLPEAIFLHHAAVAVSLALISGASYAAVILYERRHVDNKIKSE